MTEPLCTATEDCGGIAVDHSRCVGHLDADTLASYVWQLGPDEALDARGALIDADRCRQLAALLTADRFTGAVRFARAQFTGYANFGGAQFTSPADFSGAQFTGPAHFGGAQFTGLAWFGEAQFTGGADFGGAQFTGPANFGEAQFTGGADFGEAQFTGPAHFGEAQFTGPADFSGAQFTGPAWFGGAQFTGYANFGAAQFGGDANFLEAQFAGGAHFGGAQFGGDANFLEAQFGGDAYFSSVRFSRGGSFDAGHFRRRCQLGPLRAPALRLAEVVFDGPVEIHAACSTITADHVRSQETMTLTAPGGDISLAGARFAAPTTITMSPKTLTFPPPGDDDSPMPGRPRLVSCAGSDLTNVTLADLDLRACRFVGAYNLDQLHIDGPPLFAGTPPRRGRWTRRMTLAEEHHWRARYDRRTADWRTSKLLGRQPDEQDTNPSRADRTASRSEEARDSAARVAAAYRALRKSLEDAKDEPGAADFYYGEMEMRRLASRAQPHTGRAPNRVEHALLTVYWAVSGYGLRASRAFVVLLLVLALGTAGFATGGFARTRDTVYVPVTSTTTANHPATYTQTSVPTDKPGIREAVYYSVESATSLLREPATEPLTTWGKTIEIALRLLGPLLLGLALLALRGRVKR